MSNIVYQTDPTEIQRLSQIWLNQFNSSEFDLYPKSKTLLYRLNSEIEESQVTSLHKRLSKLYATIHYGSRKKCDCCLVNPTTVYSYSGYCYCDLCKNWFKSNKPALRFTDLSSITSNYTKTTFSQHLLHSLYNEFVQLSREVYSISKSKTSGLQLLVDRISTLFNEHKRVLEFKESQFSI